MFKHHPLRRSLIGGLAIAAACFPSAAQAAPTPTQQQQIDQLTENVSALFASEGGWHLDGPLTPRAAVSVQGGFQWGDAGIGAAGASVLLVGAGATVGIARRRRVHRTVVG